VILCMIGLALNSVQRKVYIPRLPEKVCSCSFPEVLLFVYYVGLAELFLAWCSEVAVLWKVRSLERATRGFPKHTVDVLPLYPQSISRARMSSTTHHRKRK